MDFDRFVHDVTVRAGLNREEAVTAVGAVLEALGACIEEQRRSRIAERLASPLDRMLLGAPPQDAPSRPGAGIEGLYSRVSEREPVRMGFAVEHTQVVCRLLAEWLDEETLEELRQGLSPEAAELLSATPGGEATFRLPHHQADHARGTLSAGRPGSGHPISEAELPLSPRGIAPHRSSVSRSANPHERTKLSSSERDREDLASGVPGHQRHPLDEQEEEEERRRR